MTAIAGVWTIGRGPNPSDACQRMLRAQELYGPHAGDQWDGEGVTLGRRLFRIHPEDDFDSQPLRGAGGRLVLVADIRLDNREELAAALNLAPPQAREMADSALLLSAWEVWGEATFDRLRGCYAFALWDQERQALVLARDPLGLRPLHFHRGAGFWAFASMPKGLHALEEIPRAPDEEVAIEFLALLHEHGSRTFFAGVERVEPGAFLTVTAQGECSTRHWNPVRRPIRLADAGEYAEAMREHLDRAVAAQLRGAGAAVAAQLSAGLDSSAVATSAARLMASSGGKVIAFTAVPRPGYQEGWKGLVDEGPLAASTAARHPNVEHVLVRTSGPAHTAALDRNHYLFDRPVFNPCGAAWIDQINRQAQNRGLTVMLTGQLGNYTFSYDGLDLLGEDLARLRLPAWFRLSRAVIDAGVYRWRGVIYHSISHWLPGRLYRWLESVRGEYGGGLEQSTAINPALLRSLDYPGRSKARGIDPYFRPAIDTFADRVACLRQVDLGNYYKGYLGGWGLDYRDPTADRRLVEFCLNIPVEQFIHGGQPRSLALRALAGRVPEAVLKEKRRGYQAADWHETAHAGRAEMSDWVDRLENCAPAARALDLPRLRKLLANWPTGGWGEDEIRYPYRYALLRGLSVGHFLHRASGSNR